MMQQVFMKKAIELANENERSGNGSPFVAVIVRAGKIIGTGINEVMKTNDVTKHAEIEAIRDACRMLNTTDLSDCELYASTEP
ncbi:hypothetical protein J14TS2_33440 [Bacillus sp. J14TS2]|uniref:nucleoside deaminase n=1 Tax=Bacillus sp. J14TS2 TaxID=2807188 RepID=UPI001B0D1374|nr:nucleoside deaminase [Bacillus sp. J14TS2]GIN72869.1 hypothetical protein J14TS2_33440 [Bacillus sp. J14TS2]